MKGVVNKISRIKKLKLWLKKHRYKVLGGFLLLFIWWWFCLPKVLFNDPTATVLFDSKNNLIGARIADDGQWRFPPRDSVPEKFKKALIQFEDRDFFSHLGFSIKAFGRALKQNMNSGEVVSGGSTISMQVIRMSRKAQRRSYYEKMVEVILSTRLEAKYSKENILALYASYAPMGGNVVGLDAAAWRYFGRSPENLSWAEAATLAVLPNAPSLIHPSKNRQALLNKRNRLLDRLFEIGEIDKIDLKLAKAEPLPDEPKPIPQEAYHLMDRTMRDGKKGKIIQSTIDPNTQDNVNNIIAYHYKKLSENQIHNAAALVLEVESGKVLAYVGNTPGNDPDHHHMVDIISRPRSTGSILKPFLYAHMLHDGELMPDQLVEDYPIVYKGFTPTNYSEKYDGAVPAHRALARSLNVPIVRMLQDYGVPRFHHKLRSMGFTTINKPAEHYGLSLVLGGSEANLWELAGVYANMSRKLNKYALGGNAKDLKPTYEKDFINDRELRGTELNPAAIWATFRAMLLVNRPDGESNWQTFSTSRKVAWKTGTSFGFRDAWAIGVTPGYVVAVWVGNASGEGRPGIVGVEAAAPILFDIINRLPNSGWFEKPHDEFELMAVCRHSGYKAGMYCEHADTVEIPANCAKTLPCPHHRLIHIDAAGYRVNSNCESVSNMTALPWFVLPPAMEWYYKNKNPNYKKLPPIREDCKANIGIDVPMAIIYPKTPSKIIVPVQFDGTQSKVVFEITHRKPSARIFWHLNETFLGETMDLHKMELQPLPGIHQLTLIDEEGNSLSQPFEVLGK
ncbi:MAG: penicillin-binding protein 1C [Flavobacteriales bacterium]